MRDVHVKLPELIQEVKAYISANAPHYGGVRVRCVTQEKDGRRQCAVWVLQAFPKGAVPAAVKSLKYREIHLLEGWLEPKDVVPLLENLKEKGITVDGETATCDLIEQQPCWAIMASANDHSKLPGRRYLLRAASNLSVGSPVLLEYGLPYYESIYEAIGAWSEVPKSGEVGSGFIGTGLLFLPECRARIAGVQRDANLVTMAIDIGAPELEGLRVQGAFGAFSPLVHIPTGVEVKDGLAKLEMPEGVEFIDCYLVGRDQTVYDYLREGPTWHEGISPVLRGAQPEPEATSVVDQALAACECETVEFKEWVDPEDKTKLDEVVKAVIGFLNTDGGQVLIGVSDEAQVVGVEGDVPKLAYGRAEKVTDAYPWYLGCIRQRVSSLIVPGAPLKCDVVDYGAHKVVVLTVAPGEDRPYYHRERRVVYVRRGSNSVIADPRTDLPSFYKPESQAYPWLRS